MPKIFPSSRATLGRLLGVALLLAFSATAKAEVETTIGGTRIHLSEVSDGYETGELAELDLGPAPPPGNSRLLSRLEVEDQLRAAGDDAKRLRMPRSLRVKSAAKRWSSAELSQAILPRLLAALPPGVTLKASHVNRGIVTSPSATLGNVRFPKIPKHVAELTLTAIVEIEEDAATVMRIPVNVSVLVTEAATRSSLNKGARINLVIEHGPARVTALATALSDLELGEVGSFRVSSTQRVLRARLVTPDTATVVE